MNFANRVYEVLKSVPPGRVTTYKHLAEKLGTRAYRAVGQALKNNPYAPIVPCHRVVKSDGRVGGFMGKRGGENINKKILILKREGVQITNGRVVDFEGKCFDLKDIA